MKELEIKIAEFLLAQGAIVVTETGEENTYYTDEFDNRFFCKNYPE